MHNGLFAECEVIDNFRGLCGPRTRTCKLVLEDKDFLRWQQHCLLIDILCTHFHQCLDCQEELESTAKQNGLEINDLPVYYGYGNLVSPYHDNSGLSWTVSAPVKGIAEPVERHGVLQTLICAPVVRPKRCPTSSNPALLLNGGLSQLHSEVYCVSYLVGVEHRAGVLSARYFFDWLADWLIGNAYWADNPSCFRTQLYTRLC